MKKIYYIIIAFLSINIILFVYSFKDISFYSRILLIFTFFSLLFFNKKLKERKNLIKEEDTNNYIGVLNLFFINAFILMKIISEGFFLENLIGLNFTLLGCTLFSYDIFIRS